MGDRFEKMGDVTYIFWKAIAHDGQPRLDKQPMRIFRYARRLVTAGAICSAILMEIPIAPSQSRSPGPAVTPSPIGGAKSARRSRGPGNREYLIRCAARRLRPPANRLPLHRFAARHAIAVSNVVLKLRRQALALLKDWTVLQVIVKVWLG